MPISFTLITEDQLSEVVAKKMIASINRNYKVTSNYHWQKDKIRERISGINQSAQGYAFFVLTDQDTHDRCPPQAIKEIPEAIHSNLLYRFAVMEIESWVMAHQEAVASFLSVPRNKIPSNTDEIIKPKEFLISLASKSKSGSIKKAIVPREGSTAKVGPNYNGRLGEFVMNHWNPMVASKQSPSLKRALLKLQEFAPVYSQ